MSDPYSRALALLDSAHSADPNLAPDNTTPYELHYARKMTHYLNLHTAPHEPSPLLSLAVRAQHLRRWEVPRSSYPDGKAGYLSWRAYLKKRQAEMAKEICLESGYGVEEAERVAGLVRKEGLISKKRKEKDGEAGNVGEEEDEVQILEDVACLVFLDDQFEEFEKEHDEEKILGILRKTWGKMGERGRELDLKIEMSGRARELVEKALKG